MDLGLRGKVALVVAASRGLGKAAAIYRVCSSWRRTVSPAQANRP